jgi:hypothetical protein
VIYNTGFFTLFILAHLIGDFVLQTNKIAALKASKLKGVLIHAGIVTAVQVVIMSVFGLNGIIAGLAGGIIHFFIDCLKHHVVKLQFIYFIADQAMHLVVILALSSILQYRNPLYDEYVPYIKLALLMIIITYVSAVAVKILSRDLFPGLKKENFFAGHERLIDTITLTLLCGSFLFSIYSGIAAVVFSIYFYYKLQKKLFNYVTAVILVKFSACLFFSFILAIALRQVIMVF